MRNIKPVVIYCKFDNFEEKIWWVIQCDIGEPVKWWACNDFVYVVEEKFREKKSFTVFSLLLYLYQISCSLLRDHLKKLCAHWFKESAVTHMWQDFFFFFEKII